jgi:hypothetical protein
MNPQVEKALYDAFLEAGKKLGTRIKGLSCFLHNWKTHLPALHSDKEAA